MLKWIMNSSTSMLATANGLQAGPHEHQLLWTGSTWDPVWSCASCRPVSHLEPDLSQGWPKDGPGDHCPT